MSSATRRWYRGPKVAVFVSCLAIYVAVGYWLQVTHGFIMGDTLSRVAATQAVLFSRDPHLAALGFIFPPLAGMVQILPMLGDAWFPDLAGRAFAGTLMSAPFMAGAAVQIFAMGADRGLRRDYTWGVTAPDRPVVFRRSRFRRRLRASPGADPDTTPGMGGGAALAVADPPAGPGSADGLRCRAGVPGDQPCDRDLVSLPALLHRGDSADLVPGPARRAGRAIRHPGPARSIWPAFPGQRSRPAALGGLRPSCARHGGDDPGDHVGDGPAALCAAGIRTRRRAGAPAGQRVRAEGTRTPHLRARSPRSGGSPPSSTDSTCPTVR